MSLDNKQDNVAAEDTSTRDVVNVEKLYKQFDDGTVAINDVSFNVGYNKITALLGPSGCGKTTTLRCIAGVETPTSGEIEIEGTTVFSEEENVAPESRNLGMVYQNYAIWPHKTVYENVVYPLKYSDIPKSEYDERVMDILELVQIPELRDTPATDLSGGQQQRTALARAVVHDPDLVLLDEPLSNLDVTLRNTMRKEIQRLQHELGLTMVYVTHDQEEAFFLSDEILIMRDGNLVEKGPPEQLYSSPKEGFTRGFVGRWNEISGTVDGSTVRTKMFDFDVTGRDLADGKAVNCYLRPTDVEIVDLGSDGNVPSDRIKATGTVISEGVIGELYEITLQAKDVDSSNTLERENELTIHTLDHLNYDRGHEVTVRIDPDDFQIYDRR